ncbi:m7GpppX diphosphatase-like [Stylophora pistillata]|uniref:m7GpppX diphosphatase n=1 Tax=Stylophora pistillata TaxID=50429 RepID=A0A2B4S6C2_STYPI|nr:m7GpppX diphosphatase-like [Stylophora pistillata]PFX24599.1 m7GpppX diphosphatase [Stylophora pistillata]
MADYDEMRPAKRVKLADENNLEDNSIQSFRGFQFIKVLNENARDKTVAVHGKFGDSESDAVVLLEKTPFSEDTLPQVLSTETSVEVEFNNDIYNQCTCQPQSRFNTLKGTIIYPASAKHLEKFSAQNLHFVQETPEVYKSITLPFIDEKSFSIQWVYNILEKKAEVERVVFEDNDPATGFTLLPDLKWDQKQIENLYLVAISHRRGIKSLRDLDSSHLPLLKNILSKGQEAIRNKYGVAGDELQVYVHYQPSYYHFHVHFTHIKYSAPGCSLGKAHLLHDVIDNIENIDSNYYSKRTLLCLFKENDKLFQRIQRANYDKNPAGGKVDEDK